MPETFADSLFGGYRAAQGDQMSRALALADQMMKEQSMQHQVRMDEIATRRADEQERRNQATEKFNQEKLAAETKWYQDQRFNTAMQNAEKVLLEGTPFGAVYPALARIDPDAAKEWGTGYVKRMQAYMDEQNRRAKRNTPPPGMEGQQHGMPGAAPPMMPGSAPPGFPPAMPPQGIPTPPQIGMPGQSAQGPPMMPPIQQPPMGQMPNQAMPPGMPLPQPGLPPQGMPQPPMAQPPGTSPALPDMPPQKQLTLEDIMGMQSPQYLELMKLKREAQETKEIHAKAAATRAANDTYRAMTTDPQRLQLQKERNDLELRKIMNDEKAMANGWGKYARDAAYFKDRLQFDKDKQKDMLDELKRYHTLVGDAAMIRANAAKKTAEWRVAQDPNRKEAVSIYNKYQAQANVAQKRSDDLQESANSLLIAINNAETLAAKSRADAAASPNNKEYAAIAAGAEANLQRLNARAYGIVGQDGMPVPGQEGLLLQAKKAKDDVQVLKHLVGQMNADLFGNKFKATTDGKGAGTIPSLPRRPKNTIQSQEDAVVNKFLGK